MQPFLECEDSEECHGDDWLQPDIEGPSTSLTNHRQVARPKPGPTTHDDAALLQTYQKRGETILAHGRREEELPHATAGMRDETRFRRTIRLFRANASHDVPSR
jgi:hypothetical protein